MSRRAIICCLISIAGTFLIGAAAGMKVATNKEPWQQACRQPNEGPVPVHMPSPLIRTVHFTF